MLKFILQGATGFSICALLSTSAFGDSRRLEEMIVTAQKRDENIQDVPIAITAISGQELESRGISDFKGVLEDTPSVYSAPYILSATGSIVLSMRGLTQVDPDDINQEGPVGFYRDGFYISRGQMMSVDLADVERVEVLRGPQGTLYGRNTIGGAINIISKKPTGDFGFKQKLSIGSRDYVRSLTGINFPSIADVATKLTLLKSEKNGYTHNPGGSHDFGEEARKGARFDAAWNPVSNFAAEYFLELGNSYSTPIYLRSPGLAGAEIFYNGSSYIYPAGDGPEGTAPRRFDLVESKSRSNGNGLTLTWDINESLTLKSLTSYFRFTGDSASDLSDVQGIPVVEYRDIGGHQFSQEFQFIGDLADGRLTYVAGLYYFKEGASLDDLTQGQQGGVQSDFRSYLAKSRAKSKAIYGQVNWTPPIMNDQINVIVGARYNWDDREGSKVLPKEGFSRGEYSESSNKFSPSLTISYHWSEDVSTYATVATGYKAGGAFQEADFEPPASPTVKPEKLTSYEIGLKSYWLDQTLRANIAGFVSKLEDRQLIFGLPNPANPFILSQFGVNIGESTISGLEVELQAQPTESLVVSLNYAYIHSKIDSFPAIAGSIYDGTSAAGMARGSPYRPGDDISSEFRESSNPKHAGTIAVDYSLGSLGNGEVSLSVDYRYQGKLEGADIPGRDFAELPGYGIFNGRINWALDLGDKGSLQLGLWGNNLTDKEYRLFAQGDGGTGTSFAPPNSPRPAGYARGVDAWAEPMTVGIDITYEY